MGLLHRKEPEPTVKFYGRQFEVNVKEKDMWKSECYFKKEWTGFEKSSTLCK